MSVMSTAVSEIRTVSVPTTVSVWSAKTTGLSTSQPQIPIATASNPPVRDVNDGRKASTTRVRSAGGGGLGPSLNEYELSRGPSGTWQRWRRSYIASWSWAPNMNRRTPARRGTWLAGPGAGAAAVTTGEGSVLISMGAGAAAGGGATGAGAGANQPADKPKVYFNLFDTFAKIATQEGPQALWRGFIPMWARIAPTTTLQLLFFEKFSKLAGISAT